MLLQRFRVDKIKVFKLWRLPAGRVLRCNLLRGKRIYAATPGAGLGCDKEQVLDVGCWVLGIGYWVLGGYRVQGSGFRVCFAVNEGVGSWVFGVGLL